MPFHQDFEGGFIPVGGEARQQIPIGKQGNALGRRQFADVPKQNICVSGRHG
jgi:hypothetical protein